MKTVLIYALLFFSTLFAAEPHLDKYQHTLSSTLLAERLQKYLIKDPQLKEYYELTDKTFTFYSSPVEKSPEFILHLIQKSESERKLTGKKIALDPGHCGGCYKYLEQRFIENGEHKFDEGTLTFLTALHLKDLLEREGATVLLTREGIGKGAYPESFEQWLVHNPEYLYNNLPPSQIFRKYYNPLDMCARAEKINQFEPDFSLILHFNAHSTDDKNFNLVFIPGAFKKEELLNREERYEFLRLLFSGDLELSEALSENIAQAMVEKLTVPLVTSEDLVTYLPSVALEIKPGVYARNLCLTRKIHSPLCYGESLIQNYPEECRKLATLDTEIHGIPCSSRLKEVAEAYFLGIKNSVS